MDDAVDARLQDDALGIPVDAWRQFLKIFADGASPTAIADGLTGLTRSFETSSMSEEQRARTADLLQHLSESLRSTE